MSEENNGSKTDEAQIILDEIEARLDAGDLERAEFQKMMLRFEFQLARQRKANEIYAAKINAEILQMRRDSEQMRRDSNAFNAQTDKRLRYLAELTGFFGDKVFQFNDKLKTAGEIFMVNLDMGKG